MPPEELKEHLDEAYHDDLDALLSQGIELVPHWEREQGVQECVKRLQRRRITLEQEAVQAQLEEGEVSLEELSSRAEQLKAELSRIDRQGQN